MTFSGLADVTEARVVERALLRRRCAGQQREREQCWQDLDHRVRHPVIVRRHAVSANGIRFSETGGGFLQII
jgi:hypothetical protein